MEVISSKANEKIKYAVKLRDSASYRKSEKKFFIESARLVKDAALSGAEIEMLFVTDEANEKYSDYIKDILKATKKAFIISKDIAEKLADTKSTQGVFAVLSMLDKFANISKIKYYGKYVALEEISNPSNFGAICRTAEAVGLDGIIIKGGCDVYNPKVQRAAMGALFRLNVVAVDDLSELFNELKSNGMKIYGSVPDSSALKITDIDKNSGMVCVIGNEGNGISDEVKSASTLVTIPMNGYAESLNAAAAATIIMWEMVR
ncbi:MAG: RNA methyltransferase [Ruminococcaceae bacterium]|nr:RNA methyltransferase [Oscillospiraceae bacterium]